MEVVVKLKEDLDNSKVKDIVAYLDNHVDQYNGIKGKINIKEGKYSYIFNSASYVLSSMNFIEGCVIPHKNRYIDSFERFAREGEEAAVKKIKKDLENALIEQNKTVMIKERSF
jgi:hypothetical protein